MSTRGWGLVLIALGVAVWLVYAALKLAGRPVEFWLALTLHLIFVIPGAILAPGENLYSRIWRSIKPAKNNSVVKERER